MPNKQSVKVLQLPTTWLMALYIHTQQHQLMSPTLVQLSANSCVEALLRSLSSRVPGNRMALAALSPITSKAMIPLRSPSLLRKRCRGPSEGAYTCAIGVGQ